MNRWIRILLLLFLVAIAATPVAAQGGKEDGQVVFGGSYTLRSGETLPGDLVVFGGQATIEKGAVVEGDVAAFSGKLEVAGHLRGDLAAFGGTVHLTKNAEVDGDLAGFGQIIQDQGAQVHGTKVGGPHFALPDSLIAPHLLPFQVAGRFRPGWTLFGLMMRILRTFITVLAITAIGALTVIFLPENTHVVGQTAHQSLAPSFGVGCLSLIVLAMASIVLMITLIGILALPFLGILAAVAILFGWVAMGMLTGERTLQALNLTNVPPIVSTLTGVFVISLLAATPVCIGPLFALLVASVGLGAVVLTRFGTRPYPEEIPILPDVQ